MWIMNFNFRREPTVILQGAQVVLAVLVSWGILGVTEELSALILAFAGAALGLINAFAVRPFAPAALTALFATLWPLLAHFGLDVSTGQMAAAQGAVLFLAALLTRMQVSPTADPAPTAPADGSVR